MNEACILNTFNYIQSKDHALMILAETSYKDGNRLKAFVAESKWARNRLRENPQSIIGVYNSDIRFEDFRDDVLFVRDQHFDQAA